eukprot:CAMPEP_0197416450 /NCGR_PEP_ID=MMETSP1170-20131217/2750_1 /TAXON_ID=54406 /ORGANISM="Sarcinochrysis sp, Strain CCMP770" /LENGTH=205 /DNA_ID=CAMNT_0042943345 /DNA_START=107 /DNA_END=724 /DNA_ORIENTATION=+
MASLFAAMLLASATAFHVPKPAMRTTMRPSTALNAVGVIYSTTTGNTENVAGYIKDAAGLDEIYEISEVSDDTFVGFDGLIVGAPTWHTGADEMRSGTSWDDFLYSNLPNMDLNGKKVAIFGVGDQGSYAENFCDAAGELYDCLKARGADIIGFTSTDDYDHDDSKAIRDGKFCGAMFDEDNQFDLSEGRAAAWISQLKSEGMPF